MAVRLDAHYKFDVIEAKKQLKHGRGGGGNGDDKSHSKKRGRDQSYHRDQGSNKKSKVDHREEPCPFHPRRDGKPASHKFSECTSCPWPSNQNYKEEDCKKVLARPNIKRDFPWFVESCEKHKGLKPPGKSSNRSNSWRRNNNNRRDQGDRDSNRNQGQEQQAPAQNQQFHFSPPAGMPPLPIGSTIQIMPPPAQASGPAPVPNTSFAFGRQQQAAPATTQQASGGGRWVLNSQGMYQLV